MPSEKLKESELFSNIKSMTRTKTFTLLMKNLRIITIASLELHNRKLSHYIINTYILGAYTHI